MKIKTSELTGAALDWAVAKCIHEPDDVVVFEGRVYAYPDSTNGFSPSTDWAEGGPIIEREELSRLSCYNHNEWGCLNGDIFYEGQTPLVAAMRCFVASRLGDEIEIPDELRA